MGAFLKIFIGIMCMSILLSIAFPGAETQFIKDNFFSLLLEEETDPLTDETYYSDLSSATTPLWSEGGNKESSFLSSFIDGLSVIKRFIYTLINIAILPITMAIRFQAPTVVRAMVFIPLSILYILSLLMIAVRGVQP